MENEEVDWEVDEEVDEEVDWEVCNIVNSLRPPCPAWSFQA